MEAAKTPMICESDIIRAARHMVTNHGVHAAYAADRRAADLAKADQNSAAFYWERIAQTIRRLQRAEARPPLAQAEPASMLRVG